MNLANLVPSDNVFEVLCSPEQASQCVLVPVINHAIQQPEQIGLGLCLYLFCLTLSIAYWVDVCILRSNQHDKH